MDFTYASVDVKEELKEMLKTHIPRFYPAPVKVLKSDPSTIGEVPCVGINRIDDSETNQSISDLHEVSYDKASKTYKEVRGTFFSEAMDIRVWHTNGDERDKLYQAIKAILFAHRLELVEKGLHNVTLRIGRDEQDSSMTWAPKPIYWATITMSYLNPLHVEVGEPTEPITAVDVTTNLTLQTSVEGGGD